MSTSPSSTTVLLNDAPKLIEFPSWHHTPGQAISIMPVDTLFFGSLMELPFPGAWRFINVTAGTGGSGVKGELIFDRKTASSDCLMVYEGALWPTGRAKVRLFCGYAADPNVVEMVEVVLKA